MMKSEFEKIVEHSITEEEYEDIEMVYLCYPGISDKQEIANLYLKYGMLLITDMLRRAREIYAKEVEISQAKCIVQNLSLELAELKEVSIKKDSRYL